MVSSRSTSATPASAGAPSRAVCSARLTRNLEATASSWRTCPKVNERRNDPSVEGAYVPVNTLPIPPWRSRAMSSMLSAPAAMPATSEDTFNPALAPLSVGTVIRSSASSRRPALRATAISGPRPAADTRLGSSNVADTTGRVWESCIYKMPFLHWRYGPSASPIFPVQRGILAFCDLQLIGGSRLSRPPGPADWPLPPSATRVVVEPSAGYRRQPQVG